MIADTAGVSLGPTAALVLVFLAYRFILHPILLSPLAHIPNAHWSSPLSRLWILNTRWTGRENRIRHALHRKLGPVIRLGPNELSISDINSVRTVYKGRFDKSTWYSVFDNYGAPCMFSTRGAAEHSARKRLISNVYSKSYIQSSLAALAQAAAILHDRLLPLLEESVSEAQIPHGIDLFSIYMAATMDFISAYIFGLGGGTDFLRNKGYRDHFLEMYKARNDYGFYDQELPAVTRFCRRLGIPFCPKWVDSANRELEDWCRRRCDNVAAKVSSASGLSTKLDTSDEPVVWRALVGGLEKEAKTNGSTSILYPTALSNIRPSIASELLDHILAGQETAGLTLSYLSWRLSKSLSLQAELRSELRTLNPNLKTNNKPNSRQMPDPKELANLPLLHALIMETLRLHAPIPGAQPRQTPDSGCQIGRYQVPGGSRIAATAYSLHRDEDVFPDSEKWDHTRWLVEGEDDEEEERKKRQRQFWAFSSGGRMCVGSNFAMHEMKLMICAIYSNYTSHIVDDSGMDQQSDGYTGRPAHERLFLRFEKVE
ncbi:cytochrome P450 [Apodospora peruviana]|uniref:Cytochrome P450 n=1 Tax=Apodospora peruviana TaxID=516989 RepID=A0AAE0I0M7_9PEZI|nr:cytochrome P450 [Apodospora peruviana]